MALPDVLPGASYGLERQCELAFGAGSKPCPFMQAPCQRLWCTGKTRGQLVCQTRHFPWADGTSCGDGQLCMRGACIDKQELTKTKVNSHISDTLIMWPITVHVFVYIMFLVQCLCTEQIQCCFNLSVCRISQFKVESNF